MNQTEIEIKCLLGTQEKADEFIQQLEAHWVDTQGFIIPERQLNHYFSGGHIMDIYQRLGSRMPPKEQELLHHICMHGQRPSVRTRNILPWDRTILVVKSSNNNDSSTHSVSRLEFEYEFPDMNMEELDRVLEDLGREYLSKRSRIRTNYVLGDITICLDQNAWYGYLVEFETVVHGDESKPTAEARLRDLMKELDIQEMDQWVLETMFKYYNAHRQEYYGTNRIFSLTPDGQTIHYGFV